MDNDRMPIVSIIMGVYEKKGMEDLLESSIRSILGQTWSNFEFLICDDGSDETIKDVVNKYAKLDNRIIPIRTEALDKKYSNLAEKLNLCLNSARGIYIARQDADDISDLSRLQKQINLLQNETLDFVGANVFLYDRKGIYGKRILPMNPKIMDFLYTQPYVHPTLVFRKESLERVNGYNSCRWAERCEDYDLLMRMYRCGLIGKNMDDKLLMYYIDREYPVKTSYKYRINEAYIRYINFKRNDLLPKAILFVFKPLIVGCIPNWLYKRIKKVDYL